MDLCSAIDHVRFGPGALPGLLFVQPLLERERAQLC